MWLKCGGKSKDRMTAMLLGLSDGKKFAPFLVMKQTTSRNADTQAANVRNQHGFGKYVWTEIVKA